MTSISKLVATAAFFIFSAAHAARPKILVTFPKDGYFHEMGGSILYGTQKARKLFPELDKKFEFIEVLTSGKLKPMGDEVLAAIRQHQPVAMIGGVSSLHAFALSDLAEKNKILYVAPYATNPGVTRGKTWTYTACFDDDFQSRVMATFAALKLKKKRAAVIFEEEDPYSAHLTKGFGIHAKKLGIETVYSKGIVESKAIEAGEIQKIRDARADFIFMPIYQWTASAAVKMLFATLPTDVPLIGTDAWAGGDAILGSLKEAKPAARAYFVEHWLMDGSSGLGQKVFESAEKDKSTLRLFNGRHESSGVALGFDAAYLILKALQGGQFKADRTTPPNLKGLRFEGASGTFVFKDAHAPSKDLFIFEASPAGLRLFERVPAE